MTFNPYWVSYVHGLSSEHPSDCPWCRAYPSIPCALHQDDDRWADEGAET